MIRSEIHQRTHGFLDLQLLQFMEISRAILSRDKHFREAIIPVNRVIFVSLFG